MTVRDIANTDVITAKKDDAVQDVVDRMTEEDVGSVVVTEGNSPVGMVTDRDIALACSEHGGIGELGVADVMTENPVTVRADSELWKLAQRMGDAGVRRFPVVGGQGELVGIVSLDDLVVVLVDELDQVGELLTKQSPRQSEPTPAE